MSIQLPNCWLRRGSHPVNSCDLRTRLQKKKETKQLLSCPPPPPVTSGFSPGFHGVSPALRAVSPGFLPALFAVFVAEAHGPLPRPGLRGGLRGLPGGLVLLPGHGAADPAPGGRVTLSSVGLGGDFCGWWVLAVRFLGLLEAFLVAGAF